MSDLRIGIVGLDTSHSIEFTRRIQAPDCPEDQRVAGMKVHTCLRFETPFQDAAGLDERTRQMEQWGVKVTEDLEECVSDVDALLVEINDPAYHLEYFRKVLPLGKPFFLDKPLADTMAAATSVLDEGEAAGARFFSASSLRFVPQLSQACEAVASPTMASVYGPLGKAPAGSSVVWYGVHAFEMLERALGRGAKAVHTHPDGLGVVVTVDYEGKRGVVELTEGAWIYGGVLRTPSEAAPFVVDMDYAYRDLLRKIHLFFTTGTMPVGLEDTAEIMSLLDAAEASLQSGKKVEIGS